MTYIFFSTCAYYNHFQTYNKWTIGASLKTIQRRLVWRLWEDVVLPCLINPSKNIIYNVCVKTLHIIYCTSNNLKQKKLTTKKMMRRWTHDTKSDRSKLYHLVQMTMESIDISSNRITCCYGWLMVFFVHKRVNTLNTS